MPSASARPLRALELADAADIRCGEQARLRSRRFGDIWLVPERTGEARFELKPEELRMIALACALFDGKIVEVSRNVRA